MVQLGANQNRLAYSRKEERRELKGDRRRGKKVESLLSPFSPLLLYFCGSAAKVAGTGFEHPANSSENHGGGSQGVAESGALGAENASITPSLREVVDAWPKLPEAIKAGILAVVRMTGDAK